MKTNRFFVLAIALAASLCAGCDPTFMRFDDSARADMATKAAMVAGTALRDSAPRAPAAQAH